MGNRRMFSNAIVASARFIKMPASTQSLYFHLGMNADDDGIVEAYTIMRTVGASEDDLKILMAKGFIQVLNDDLVSFIKDWTEHNLIRADRKVDSKYKDLLLSIVPEAKLIEAHPRADTGKCTGRPMDSVSKDKLREVKVSKEKRIKPEEIIDFETLFEYWEQNKRGGGYKRDSRERMLDKLKQLTGNNLEFAKNAIFHAVDSKYMGFCNGAELYYKGKETGGWKDDYRTKGLLK